MDFGTKGLDLFMASSPAGTHALRGRLAGFILWPPLGVAAWGRVGKDSVVSSGLNRKKCGY